MSTQIDYQIQFYSEWHCGSGLSAGADTDALVLKDKDGLPYIPGKTLKGLLREAAEEILSISKQPIDKISQAFGYFDEKDSRFSQGTLFFTNATLNEKEREAIISEGLKPFLYNRVASTAIGDNGIAQDGSLRSMETVLPCTLEGSIRGVEDDKNLISLLEDAMHYVKCLGVNRNRGLGRCDITIKKEGGEK